MDPLVKAALDRVIESVMEIPWDELEAIRQKQTDHVRTGGNIAVSIGAAVHSTEALKSALLSVPNTCM